MIKKSGSPKVAISLTPIAKHNHMRFEASWKTRISSNKKILIIPKVGKYGNYTEIHEIEWQDLIEWRLVDSSTYEYTELLYYHSDQLPVYEEKIDLGLTPQLTVFRPVNVVLQKVKMCKPEDYSKPEMLLEDLIYVMKLKRIRNHIDAKTFLNLYTDIEKINKVLARYNGTPYEGEQRVAYGFLEKLTKQFRERICQLT